MVETLDQLVELIDSSDKYDELKISEIIKENGWKDLQSSDWDICSDGNRTLSFLPDATLTINDIHVRPDSTKEAEIFSS